MEAKKDVISELEKVQTQRAMQEINYQRYKEQEEFSKNTSSKTGLYSGDTSLFEQ